MKEPNDIILHAVIKVAVVIILTFSINLFFSGHHNPGGGFIGGLGFSAALTLLFLAFDIETVRQNIPVDFKVLTAIGVLIAVFTGVGGIVFGEPFLTQAFDYFDIPVFGKTELATAVLFDVGVALAVIGTSMSIILSIGDDH
ncbi:Na(+)/H(+) antiporter subunit B [Cytobacillus firmus]|uniref:Na(+) H(+) antiporter subunit B n=1 Tax=Cytobacillus firmus TaxID=1399 RepID=A0A380XZF5_CYTFI|nr:Na(+)/H(+) antiporter subunit B [Cytobacillus firmus]KAF0823664.1 Na(+) H(+) antiporter subunit B [Cytobacillus firmus]MBG9543527.1 monovalent cation/H+ antiporter subunit B [Cytobacillus firmus]MBG9554853.1 monovalent cation/H+ antiporter subunit B [Cytobacillus firmus]MBG9559573.1 monovalent cation/H+ antiporter subunit B [Cytobacillus firmus]MBG9577301.1 monovalent cation/H+ antiporter subunit B [Cytobacillus firmus]